MTGERPALLTECVYWQLMKNGHETAGGDTIDPPPVVKLFTPDANATWLLTEIDPDDEDRAFGLCDLGLGFPELGWVRFSELQALRGPFGLPVENDRHFKSDRPLSDYVDAAKKSGRIAA